jgi:hypothetical protein
MSRWLARTSWATDVYRATPLTHFSEGVTLRSILDSWPAFGLTHIFGFFSPAGLNPVGLSDPFGLFDAAFGFVMEFCPNGAT